MNLLASQVAFYLSRCYGSQFLDDRAVTDEQVSEGLTNPELTPRW